MRIKIVFYLIFALFFSNKLFAQNTVSNGEKNMTTQILITADGITIPAILNNTVAAQDFKKRLPFVVSGHRSSVDYCCVAESGNFDPDELQSGWKNGDISLAGGWFAVLFDGEESSARYTNMMIIASIDEKHLDLVKNLPDDVTFKVELAEND